MKKGLTYGEFSNISKGHISFLENTRKLCDSLIVAIKEDNGIKTTTERTEDLLKTNLVDDVVPVVSASDCVNMIDEYGINIYFYGNKANILDLNCETVFVDSGIMLIPNLVVVTGYACTLRCKNCANFTPIAPPHKLLYSINDIIADLQRILKYATINALQIQGGEAFLHPHLDLLLKFIIENKSINTCVIATNGTIIPDIDVTLLNHLKMTIRISNYQVPGNKHDELKAYCRLNGVRTSIHNFASEKGMWHDLGEGEQEGDIEERFSRCTFRGCLTLEEHKLGYCSRSIIAEAIQRFTPPLPHRHHVPRLAGDYCYVNDEADFRERLINYVANPHHMEACRYCNGTWNTPLIEPAVQLS